MGLLRCLNLRSCPTSSAFFNYPAAQRQLLDAAPGCGDRFPERSPPPSTERRPSSPSSYGQLLGLSIAPANFLALACLAPSSPLPGAATAPPYAEPGDQPCGHSADVRGISIRSRRAPHSIREGAAGSQRPVPRPRAVPSHARLGDRSHRGPINHQPSVGQEPEFPRNLRGTEHPQSGWCSAFCVGSTK
jgi:hypothetical protein